MKLRPGFGKFQISNIKNLPSSCANSPIRNMYVNPSENIGEVEQIVWEKCGVGKVGFGCGKSLGCEKSGEKKIVWKKSGREKSGVGKVG